MRKVLQGFVVTFAFVCMFALFGQVASAEVSSVKDVPKTVEVPPVESFNYEITPFAMSYLRTWGTNAVKVSSTKIDFKVETETYGIRDRVGAKTYIQYYSNGKWNDAYYVGDRYDTNVSSVLIYGNATVSTGYYYRLKSINYAVYNGDREEAISYSQQLLMN
ncbi:MAG TPA: hypothetical protein GX525_06360 [Bacilli bacterium]|nr:hypothetical protein [Bacilli bacterium]